MFLLVVVNQPRNWCHLNPLVSVIMLYIIHLCSFTAPNSFIGGGASNVATGTYATVAGGYGNRATSYVAAVTGGQGCQVTAQFGAITGGFGNVVTANYGFVGGGSGNKVTANYGAVSGGQANTAAGEHSFAVGYSASAQDDRSGVFGFNSNGYVPRACVPICPSKPHISWMWILHFAFSSL